MPPESSTRILFVGDMHLGRLPSRVPTAALDQGGMTLGDLGPVAAWYRVIDFALLSRVHAVALAGDLVEGDNALFEAYGPLATGVRRLTDSGITVAAVAGNHDTVVLPRLATEIEGFHLLGPGGTWSAVPVPGEGGLAVNLVGWSFPDRRHTRSPLEKPLPETAGPTLGLLHADLDAFGSDYAPVRSSDLSGTGLQGWFLGHVHKPGEVTGDGSPFYLGSLTGLNPGETGLHGPVLVEVSGTEELSATRLPLAPLRWEHLAVDCSALDHPATQLESHLLGRVARFQRELEAELAEVRALGVRVTLTGTVADPAAVENALRDLGELITLHENTVLFVQKITNRLTGRLDLVEVARRNDPPGLLARRILALENHRGGIPGVTDSYAMVNALVNEARQVLARVDSAPAFKELGPASEELTAAKIREDLARAARLALAGMLSQAADTQEAGHAAG